jgi:glycosyltransferase involved in cell wall biosynthesis
MQSPDLMQHPLVSVIIPTFNSEKQLPICLESIKKQIYDNIEIIIADGYSTDKTIEIASQYGAKIIQKKSPFTPRRNYGATKASGEIYYHMDSDMMLPKELVETAVKQIVDGYDGVIIPQRFGGEGFWGKCKELEVLSSTNNDKLKICRFMRKKVFDAVGGYDESLEAGEDWDITQRIEKNYRLIRINVYVTHGWGKYELSKWIGKMYYYGKTVKKYQDKHKTYSKYQWSPLRFFSLDYKMLMHDPLHTCGIVFIKSCEFFSGFVGLMNKSD